MKRKIERTIVIFSVALLILSFFSFIGSSFDNGIDYLEESEEKTRMIIDRADIDLSELEKDESISVLAEYESYFLVEIIEEEIEVLKSREASFEKIENHSQVRLPSYSFDTDEGEPEIPDELKVEDYSDEDKGQYIIQFIGPIKSEWRETLEDKGVEFHEFKHRFNFVTEMDPELVDEIEDLEFIQWIGIYQPAYRFDKELLDKNENFKVAVSTFKEVRYDSFSKEIDQPDEPRWTRGKEKFALEVSSNDLIDLANHHNVKFITGRADEYKLLNSEATWITQTNEENNRKVTEEGVIGENELITIMDSELYGGNSDDPDHEMWSDPDGNEVGDHHRKIQDHYVPDGADGDLNAGDYHGTHVVGTAIGDTEPYGEYNNSDGNALGARLIFQDAGPGGDSVEPPSDMYENAYDDVYERGSRIHSNSWGIEENEYTELPRQSDEFIWDHKDFNVLFAMGNEGPYERSLEGQAEGKNVLSVGAGVNSPYQDEVADFSSRGYADDGRIKPTLLHMGQWVNSADRSEDSYDIKSGTSMSTPGIAGQVGQVRQYYNEGWHVDGTANHEEGFNPSNALVRATLINSAVEISGEGAYENDESFPNNDQGFGRSKLDRALHFEGDERDLIAYDSGEEDVELDTGESWSKNFEVEDTSQELEVTLAWTDYPGSIGSDESDPAIVNDLDLEVEAPDGTKYVGNAFTGHNPGYSEPDPNENQWSGPRNSEYDGLNVEENVLLLPDHNEIQEGGYEVNIEGYNVPEESQPFALVISGGVTEEIPGEPPEIDIERPTEGDTWEATEEENIEWESYDGDGIVEYINLHYRTEENEIWNLVEEKIDDTGGFTWEVPNYNSNEVQIKAEAVDNESRTGEDVSDKFTIEGIPPGSPNDLEVDHAELKENWHWLYDEEHREVVDTAIGIDNEESWKGAMRTELPDGELKSVAYYHGDDALSVQASIHEDDGNVPGEEIGRTFELNNFEEDEWHDIPLKEPVSIESDQYWIVLNIEDRGDGYYPFGMYDHEIEDGGYIKHSGIDGWETRDYTWALEAKVTEVDDNDNIISWDASQDDPDKVSHYNIYRGQDKTELGNDPIDNVTADGSNSYEFIDENKGLADDTFWWYGVRAVGENGVEEKNENFVQEPIKPFHVEIYDVEPMAYEDEDYLVNYRVKNIGEEESTQYIVFSVDNEFHSLEEVTIEEGQEHEDEFIWTPGEGGFYTLEVRSDDHADRFNVEVIEDSKFEIEIGRFERWMLEGEELEIEYTVENTGGIEDTQDITIQIIDHGLEDEVVYEDIISNLTLDGAERYHGSSIWQTEQSDADRYSVEVKSEDDEDTRPITVYEKNIFAIDFGFIERHNDLDEEVIVNYTVINTYDEPVTQDIELTVVDDYEEIVHTDIEENIALESKEQHEGSFKWDPEETGSFEIKVASEDDNETADVQIWKQDSFGVTVSLGGRHEDENVSVGDRLSVLYHVRNTKDQEDTQDIKFLVDGTEIDVHESLTLDSEEEERDSFTWNVTEPIGERNLKVESEDDSDQISVEVFEGPNFQVQINEPEDEQEFEPNEDVVVNITVFNQGDQKGEENIGISAEEYLDEEITVELEPDESEDHEFTFNIGEEKRSVNIGVFSRDISEVITIFVESDEIKEPHFEVEINHPEDGQAFNPNENITLHFTLINTGDVEGNRDVSIFIDDELVEERDVYIEPGDIEEEEYTFHAEENQTHMDITVSSRDEEESITISISEDEEQDDDEDDEPGIPGFNLVYLLISLLIVVIIHIKKYKEEKR